MGYVQMTLDDWAAMKQSILDDLRGLSEGFVRVGYKLRQIRDQELYRTDGYDSIADWARDSIGLDAGNVSRFIAINEKYSAGGNSPQLQDQFVGYGYSKLAEMLRIPVADMEMVRPEASREGIRELKRFNKEGGPGIAEDEDQLIRAFWENNIQLAEGAKGAGIAKAKGMLIPSGNRSYRRGLYMMMFYSDVIKIKKFGQTPREMTWEEFWDVSEGILNGHEDEDGGTEETVIEAQEVGAGTPETDAEGHADGLVTEVPAAERMPAHPVESMPVPVREDRGTGQEKPDRKPVPSVDRRVQKALTETDPAVRPNGMEVLLRSSLDTLTMAINAKAYKTVLNVIQNMETYARKLMEEEKC